MHGPAKQELQRACAIHCNIRAKYTYVYMLHQEALKIAQSYEKQVDEALSELEDLTEHVGTCMNLALQNVVSTRKQNQGQSGSEVTREYGRFYCSRQRSIC
jgi:hypothetical protein